MPRHVRIATRASQLARWQAEQVAVLLESAHPGLSTELVPLSTRGDRIQDRPLSRVGGKGLFTKELERALLAGEADVAAHSMKDVPVSLPEGFVLAAALQREDPRDAFLSQHHADVAALPEGARVGTASLRRRAQLARHRPDLDIRMLRGNVNTRIARLEAGDFDAIILAAAGLKRLGWEARITALLEPELCLPAIGQGVIGLECRAGDTELIRLCAALNHAPTATCLEAERALNRRLHGGCDVPLAGYAVLEGETLWLRGLVAAPDGSALVRAEARGPAADPAGLGLAVAEDMLARGAGKILEALRHG